MNSLHHNFGMSKLFHILSIFSIKSKKVGGVVIKQIEGPLLGYRIDTLVLILRNKDRSADASRFLFR